MKWSILVAAIALLIVLAWPVRAQIGVIDQAQSQEFSASAKDGRGAVELQGTLFLPRSASPVRGVVVVLLRGLGSQVYQDPAWRELAERLQCGLLGLSGRTDATAADLPVAERPERNAAAGGAEALVTLLTKLAMQSRHPELRDAKLLLWGSSAAGSFVATFAALQPARTIGFIRFQSDSRGLPLDVKTLARIPALLFAGANDASARVGESEALWASGRALHAPWTFAVQPDAPHGSPDALKKANELAIAWVRGVFAARVTGIGAGLRPIDDASGWFASTRDREIAPAGSFRGAKAEASWLPDEASAKAWRVVCGIQP